MNKNRIILIAIGGVFGVAVLAMAYLVMSSLSAKTAALEGDSEAEEPIVGLNEVEESARALSKAEIYPSKKSVAAIGENVKSLEAWQKEAQKLASRGDRVFPKTTPAAFKAFIVADAKRLSAMPGMMDGKLVKGEFGFGPFKDYITEGKMPAEEKLADLQRQWDDIVTVTEQLVEAGAAELVDVQFAKAAVEEQPAEDSGKKGRNKAKKSRNTAKKAASADLEPKKCSYDFTFRIRPAGFVKVVNALATCDRFITVDKFTFFRDPDVIAAALGEEKKQSGESAGASRGRRARRRVQSVSAATESADEKDKARNGIVTDPAIDPPLKVTMTVSVYDFHTLEDGVGGEEVAK